MVGLCACQDKSLEKRVADLETKVKALDDEHNERAVRDAEDVAKQSKFEGCVARANDDYLAKIRSNGTKSSKGGYNVDVRVEQAIERTKQNKLEECKLLYK